MYKTTLELCDELHVAVERLRSKGLVKRTLADVVNDLGQSIRQLGQSISAVALPALKAFYEAFD